LDYTGRIYTIRGEKVIVRNGNRSTSVAGLPAGVYIIR
jgi:hypothetical protein